MSPLMKYFSQFSPRFISTLVYMLQSTEYKTGDYVAWLRRAPRFDRVIRRRSLDYTAKARLLVLALWIAALMLIGAAVGLVVWAPSIGTAIAALLLFAVTPWLLSRLVLVPLWFGRVFIQLPKERRMIREARGILARHKGYKIAIAGSYGKTTAKEVLRAVLGASKNVAVTPGNMNTAIGISRFARKLTGDEDILVIELGEERVGDVARLCALAQPDSGFLTGVSAAHLASFGTMENIVSTLFEIRGALKKGPLYVNDESDYIRDELKDDDVLYSRTSAGHWKVSGIATTIEGTTFTATKGKKTVKAHTKLLGEHNVGVVAAAIALADSLGIAVKDIERGVSDVRPFEHRMEPRKVGGAWVIDDTYNGNIAGVRAGLELLKNLDAKRKIYVTPGLVEQGDETEPIHNEIGMLIARADVDEAVLMNNSVTQYILDGLGSEGFRGKVTLVDDPLTFYTNLDQHVAHGDVVLMQNDWTDNYN